jgi:Zn-dependent metalloprotease
MCVLKFCLFFGFVIFSMVQALNGQEFKAADAEKVIKGSRFIRVDSATGSIQFIQLREDAKIYAPDAEAWLSKTVNLSDKQYYRKISESREDKVKQVHSRYQLYYKGLPVEGAIYNIHAASGKILSANGDYYRGQEIEVNPILNESEAFREAVRYVNARKYKWEAEKASIPGGELVILPADGKYLLAYKFDIYAVEPLSRQYVFVDARSGNILKTLNRIHEDNNAGKAETIYSGIVDITTDFFDGHFRLREKGRGEGIETYNLKKATSFTIAIDFTDDDNYWNTVTNSDNAAFDVHYALEAVYDFYNQKFDRNSYDDLGTMLKGFVHYGENYANAFWDGNYVFFGDGQSTRSGPYTSLDIVAHEITHGVIQSSAGLVYENESGALAESFADIFAVTIDFFKNQLKGNYKIGELVTLSHRPFRDMANPEDYHNPDTYKGLYWDAGNEVHYNSGVQNYWYYLLCEGGSGKNDNGDSFVVKAIGMEKAARIAFRTLTVYLTPNSEYADARFYSIRAAKDLFGDCSPEASSVASAWHAVGIGDANDCYSPENLTASQTGSTMIRLNWKKNSINDNVLIAYSSGKNLGNPVDGIVYLPGDSIPGGGVVIYSGSLSEYTHTGLGKVTKYYYKAWSVKAGNYYSGGVTATNSPPVIDAGTDQKLVLPLKSEISIAGKFPDDLNKDSVSFKWDKTFGKGVVKFNNSGSLNTVVSFTDPGKYTLRLAMSYFGFESIDSMHVIVSLTDSISGYSFAGHHNWMGLDVQGNYAYLADLVFGLRIMDISNKLKPVMVSEFEKFDVNFVHVEENNAFVSFRGGLMILNIQNKSNPVLVNELSIPTSLENHDFIVKDGIVFYASNPDGIIIIDAKKVSNPVIIGKFPCSPISILLKENYLYVTDRASYGLDPFVLDVSDPANPKKIADFPKIFAYYLAPDAIQGEYLYRCQQNLDEKFYFCIYDISDRKNPQLKGSTEISWNNASISIQGNYAYLNDGLRVIDITDKSDPVEKSNEYALSFDQVKARDNYIYSTRGEAFMVYKSYLKNTSPYIYAGPDRSVDTIPFVLHGEVVDDGFPEGALISSSWSKISGSGEVIFSDIHKLSSTISFSDTGRYVIRLSGTDGKLSSYDDVEYHLKDKDIVTAINKLASNDLSLYPNPTTGIIYIDINDIFNSDFVVSIYNGGGKLLQTLKMDAAVSLIEVDMVRYIPGVYIIHLQNSANHYAIKVIKR